KDYDTEDIERNLMQYAEGDLNRKTPKNNEVYDITSFRRKDEFLNDINSDITIFENILNRLQELRLVEKDPKQEEIIQKIKKELTNNPERKIILFSEYV